MSIDITASVVIERQRQAVAAFVMDPANDTKWIQGIKSVQLLGDGPLNAGTQVARVAYFLGRRVEYVNEIVELVAGEKLIMRSVKAPFPMRISYAFEDAPGGTRVSDRVQGDVNGFYGVLGLLSPLMALVVKVSVSRDLQKLKGVLESLSEDANAP